MEYAKIGKLTEKDFDEIIAKLGGRRFSPDHSREKDLNTDYVLGNAVIELKLINEEGLEKEERRRKIADIFRARQPARSVIVLRPDLLDTDGQRGYYNTMAGPIKRHVTKANNQLKQSAETLGSDTVRVLLLINNGYATLSHHEFKDIAIRRACNDTHNIDAVVIAGLYLYSDTFDSYFFPMMDLFPLHIDRAFTLYNTLFTEWVKFGQNLLTQSCIFGEDDHEEQRLSVQELTYELDEVTYIKPAPKMGVPSEFFKDGRPRQNSSGITTCPSVAKTFPDFDEATWRQFKQYLADDFFKATYAEWIDFRQKEEGAIETPTKPFVSVPVTFDAWVKWCEEQHRALTVQSLCEYASIRFSALVLPLIDDAMEQMDSSIILSRYVLVTTEVIGQDMANDLSSIYLVTNNMKGEYRIPLAENLRIFSEHGVALAAAYALKHHVPAVKRVKDLTNAWV